MGSEGLSKKMSFSIDVGDGKKLRLIDMAKEDDYLIASPFFDSLEDLRLSVTLDSSHADETYKCQGIQPCAARLQQNEPELVSSSTSSLETGRPSYMRKSLAWDTAFFTNDGVLDPDELFLMNEGLKSRSLPSVQEDMLLRRSEPAPITFKKNADARSQPKFLPHFQMKYSKHISKGKSTNTLLQSSDKSKNQIARSAEYQRTSLKPPKASGLLRGIPTGRGQTPLMRKKNDLVAKEDKSVQTRAVSSFASTKLVPSNSQPRRVAATSPDISNNYLKRKTESTRSKLSASVSIIAPSRYPEKTQRQATDLRHSTQSLPAIFNYSSGELTSDFTVNRSVIKRSKECPEPNPHNQFFSLLESEINSPLPYSAVSPFGTSTAPTQSGLRMPSPTMGYFDEDKPAARTATGGLRFQLQMGNKSPSKSAPRHRKTPAKVANSPLPVDIHHRKHRCVDEQHLNRKLTTASDVGHTPSNLSRSRNLCAGKYSRRKIDENSTLKREEKKQMKESSHSMVEREKKRYKSKGQMGQVGREVNKLSELLGVIDLNEVKVLEPKQRRFQYSTTLNKENVPQMSISTEPTNPPRKKNIRLL